MTFDWAKYDIEIPGGRRSGQLKLFCPRCQETRRHNRGDKPLSVDLRTGLFHCHHCGYSGCAAVSEEEERRRLYRTWDAIRDARGRRIALPPSPTTNPQSPDQEMKETQHYPLPGPLPEAPLSERLLTWLQSRGISAETAREADLREGEEFMPQDGRRVNTVQFPYRLDGQLVNVKYRTGSKHFKLVAGARRPPWRIDAIKGTPECIITEGEMDTLAFMEAGRKDVVSVPTGAGPNTDWLDDYIESHFEGKRTVYIASDTDEKGLVLRQELLRRLGPERCRIVTYGEGCKDADDHLMRHGAESLLRCLDEAQDIKVEGVYDVSDFSPLADRLWSEGRGEGARAGLGPMDELIRWETGRLCVVTGIPSSGKSEFIDQVLVRLNLLHGWKAGYFSPENQPLEYHASKLVEKLTGKPFGRSTLPEDEYREAMAHISRNFFFILPSDKHLDRILDCARWLVRRRGIKVLVIDPYNTIEEDEYRDTETKHICRVLTRLQDFAKREDVLVILQAHPSKPPRDREGRPQVPDLYSINGSSHFYNKADYGLVVNRCDAKGYVELRVDKVRFSWMGRKGSAYFRYNARNGRYTPMLHDQDNPEHDYSNHLRPAPQGQLPASQAPAEPPACSSPYTDPTLPSPWQGPSADDLPF